MQHLPLIPITNLLYLSYYNELLYIEQDILGNILQTGDIQNKIKFDDGSHCERFYY